MLRSTSVRSEGLSEDESPRSRSLEPGRLLRLELPRSFEERRDFSLPKPESELPERRLSELEFMSELLRSRSCFNCTSSSDCRMAATLTITAKKVPHS